MQSGVCSSMTTDQDLFDSIDDSRKELQEERSAVREFDAGFTREEAERLGMLDSKQWMLACLVRTVADMEPFARRKLFVENFKKSHGDMVANQLVDGLRKARESKIGPV